MTPAATASTAAPSEPPAWATGTYLDQFTPIYLALAIPQPGRHRGFSPAEVDDMDLTTIWAFMGVEEARRARAASIEKWRGAPETAMVPLTDEEKAERLAALEARLGRS